MVTFNDRPPPGYSGPLDGNVAIRVLIADPDTHRVDIQITVRVPEAKKYDPEPTERMREAVRALFPHLPDTLTDSQCHAVLTFRDYARAVVEKVLGLDAPNRKLWETLIATLVSHDDEVAQDVIRWSDRRWRKGSDAVRIMQTKNFVRILNECRVIEESFRSGRPYP
jgi:hypothetical protein